MTAPAASSGCHGTPILRTITRSSGAFRTLATSAATGTPPRGSASTTGSGGAFAARAFAKALPASTRFSKMANDVIGFSLPMESEPLHRRLHNLVKSSLFLEQMRGTGHHEQALYAAQLCESVSIELQHTGIITAYNQQGWRTNIR